ncbi:hypothetical protein HWI03_004377 [Salmonella enterica]|nr:hypothetical protein [Salmonella enterica]EHQ1050845.1 hypothetical protein [Salmonella enterica]EIC4369800.1 hypothetical protein [Salmonella enterica]EJL1151270.1 hypothetical protein [Salmonella enterica]
MTTTAKMINRDWQQITDGTQSALVQIFGSADVCDSQVRKNQHSRHAVCAGIQRDDIGAERQCDSPPGQ